MSKEKNVSTHIYIYKQNSAHEANPQIVLPVLIFLNILERTFNNNLKLSQKAEF